MLTTLNKLADSADTSSDARWKQTHLPNSQGVGEVGCIRERQASFSWGTFFARVVVCKDNKKLHFRIVECHCILFFLLRLYRLILSLKFIQAKSRPDDLTLVARASALQNVLPCSLWFASVLRPSEWEMSPEICFSSTRCLIERRGMFHLILAQFRSMVIIVTPCPSGRVHQSWWTWNTGIGCDELPHRNVQPSEVQLSRCGYRGGLCLQLFQYTNSSNILLLLPAILLDPTWLLEL